jgi:maleylacetoacetate isomerase
MSGVTLFDYYRSSASYRVRIALNLKEVSYDSVAIHLVDGEQRAPANLARNPQGLVPTLEIDGHRLTQSLAIIDYLDAKYPHPPLVSRDPARRAQTLAQALLISADIHPIDNLRVLAYLRDVLGVDQAGRDTWYRHWVAEGFRALEALAADAGTFLGGEAPDLADICLVPQMFNARRFNLPLDEYPTLVRIDAACAALEPFAAAHPDRVEPKA